MDKLKELNKSCPNCSKGKLFSQLGEYLFMGWAERVSCDKCDFVVYREPEI